MWVPTADPGWAPLRVLFYYRGIESLGVGYLMSMLKHHGHEVDLIFEPGLDDNGVPPGPAARAPSTATDALIERAKAFDPDLVCHRLAHQPVAPRLAHGASG